TPLNWLLWKVEGAALRDACLLIFPEKGREVVYRERYRLTSKTFLAYNCPRLREKSSAVDLRARHKLPSDAHLMLYLGGIGEINALSEAIEALQQHASVYFLLAGWVAPKYRQHLESVAQKFNVTDRVMFLGEVENKWEYLDNSDFSYCI